MLASAYHWQRAARRAPINEARALYMLSRAHLFAALHDRALHYADECMAATIGSTRLTREASSKRRLT